MSLPGKLFFKRIRFLNNSFSVLFPELTLLSQLEGLSCPCSSRVNGFPLEDAGFNHFVAGHVTPCASFAS